MDSELTEIVAVPGEQDVWRVGDTEFVHRFGLESSPGRFRIRKPASLIALYADLCSHSRGGHIVELGIAAGGGTALLALAAQPSRLIACELDTARRPALDAFIDEHHLGETVHLHYGIDQADRDLVARVAEGEFGDEPIDLVIDDASHIYAPTLASFEVLFPRLRPGGVFVIEDWAADYFYAAAIAETLRTPGPESDRVAKRVGGMKYRQDAGAPKVQPLPRIAVQLLLAAAASPSVIADVGVNVHWLTIRRGNKALDRDGFALDSLYADHFGWLNE